MSEPTYHIVFRGDIQMGQTLPQVKQNLATLFGLDIAKVEALFTGKPVVLKRNLNETSAAKFKAALARAGAVVAIKADATAASTANSTAASQYTWTLAPAGMNLLRIAERKKRVPAKLGTIEFSLREQQGHLLDETEKPSAPVVAIAALNVDLAPVGESLLREQERASLPPPLAAPEWGIAPVGADLTPVAIAEAVPFPDISHLSLSESK